MAQVSFSYPSSLESINNDLDEFFADRMAEEISQIRENYLNDKADGFEEHSEDSYHYTTETFLQEMFERDFLLPDSIYQEFYESNLEEAKYDFNAATVSGMVAFILHQAEERRTHTGLFELGFLSNMEDLVQKYAWDYLNDTYLAYDDCDGIKSMLAAIVE